MSCSNFRYFFVLTRQQIKTAIPECKYIHNYEYKIQACVTYIHVLLPSSSPIRFQKSSHMTNIYDSTKLLHKCNKEESDWLL